MFKLVRYEFRKSRTSLLVLLAIIALLQVVFQYGFFTEKQDPMIIATILMPFCAFGSAIFVLVRGIAAYSGELRSRQGYMVFLTPNSTLKIVASKFLYTFLNALFFFAVFVALLLLDVSQVLPRMSQYRNVATLLNDYAVGYGVNLREIGLYTVFYVLYVFIALLGTVAVAYLAITISATFFRDKSWRWIISLLLFFGITMLLNQADQLLLDGLDAVKLVDVNLTGRATGITENVVDTILAPALLSTGLVRAAVIAGSMFGCAFMLDRKVSL